MAIPLTDAVVALSSFPRRYRAVLSGPPGDDAWERLVRTVPIGAMRSPLGWGTTATALLVALRHVAESLPSNHTPKAFITAIESSPNQPGSECDIADLIGDLDAAATGAAAAVKARSHDDERRTVSVDGVEQTFAGFLDHIVQAVAMNIRHAEDAVQANR